MCSTVGESGGNIISVSHERINTSTAISGCTIRVELETRDKAHIDELRRALQDKGYNVLN